MLHVARRTVKHPREFDVDTSSEMMHTVGIVCTLSETWLEAWLQLPISMAIIIAFERQIDQKIQTWLGERRMMIGADVVDESSSHQTPGQ
jgi:hypothetical protein